MKPEIVFIRENDGMVQMTKEGLQDLIDKAYQAGRADAPGTITQPYVVQPTPTWWDKTTITCMDDGK